MTRISAATGDDERSIVDATRRPPRDPNDPVADVSDNSESEVAPANVDISEPIDLGRQPPSPRRVLGWMLPSLAAAVLATVYGALSLRRHAELGTGGFDLGIFVQEVRSYATWRLPFSALKFPGQGNLLADHFSPITAVLAPFFRLFPYAQTLLVAQALLCAVAVVPITRFAWRRLGPTTAAAVAVGYGLSWGIANAVGFDFHEVAFAVPLLAFSAVALAEARYRAAVWWALPLVLVKEDLGLTVAVVGVLVAVTGRAFLGIATAVGGFAASAAESFVIMPAFSPTGAVAHAGYFAGSGWHAIGDLLTPDTKLVTLVMLLAPTAFVACRSRLLWLAAPTLAWRFLSGNAAFWGSQYHYSAVLMPIVFVAFVDGLSKIRSRPSVRWLLAASLVITAYLVPRNAFDELLHRPIWQTSATQQAVHDLLGTVPSGATVCASNNLAAQLAARTDVTLFGYTPLSVSKAHYLVVDTADPGGFPLSRSAERDLLAEAETQGYHLVSRAGSVELLLRG
ncbi:MAG: DUF2079 domain-containing protein [Actinomycetota bacterium]|nr:DUF2079 domain-containing protein [Actinomycetota bacterium]